ncbi:hypothetical protein HMPREF1604_01432 [Escherichia coli 908519]|nr:hypothetical protein HMPREF1604_01432 [Escherichia coli 908519]
MSALSGLQNLANSIYCRDYVGLISIAHQAVLRLHNLSARFRALFTSYA